MIKDDGIYFEVFAMKDGIRYNMKIISSKDVATILTNSIMNGVGEIISLEEMAGDDK